MSAARFCGAVASGFGFFILALVLAHWAVRDFADLVASAVDAGREDSPGGRFVGFAALSVLSFVYAFAAPIVLLADGRRTGAKAATTSGSDREPEVDPS
ncbi:MAG: hypothetical protein AAGA42_18035 [Actinomycetota bacterium]